MNLRIFRRILSNVIAIKSYIGYYFNEESASYILKSEVHHKQHWKRCQIRNQI